MSVQSVRNLRKHWALWVMLTVLVSLQAGCSADAEVSDTDAARPGVLDLESFLTNINDPSGERYCKLTLKLAVVPAEKVAEIQADPLLLARIRDQVLTLLSGKTLHELSDPTTKEAFREDLRANLTGLIEGVEIQQVLFSEFVVQ